MPTSASRKKTTARAIAAMIVTTAPIVQNRRRSSASCCLRQTHSSGNVPALRAGHIFPGSHSLKDSITTHLLRLSFWCRARHNELLSRTKGCRPVPGFDSLSCGRRVVAAITMQQNQIAISCALTRFQAVSIVKCLRGVCAARNPKNVSLCKCYEN